MTDKKLIKKIILLLIISLGASLLAGSIWPIKTLVIARAGESLEVPYDSHKHKSRLRSEFTYLDKRFNSILALEVGGSLLIVGGVVLIIGMKSKNDK